MNKNSGILLLLAGLALPLTGQDIVIEDFSGNNFGSWTAEGSAFGSGPENGAANSNSAAQGSITSPVFIIEREWINFKIGGGHWPEALYMELVVGGESVRRAWGNNNDQLLDKSWYVKEFIGAQATLVIVDVLDQDPITYTPVKTNIILDDIVQSNTRAAFEEAYRPQFHYTPENYWINDPNGMVYYDGEYHLFSQHNPNGLDWGYMTWGHAVSKDLVHWEHLPHAIFGDGNDGGCPAYSGGAFVDWDNSSGWQTGNEKVLVASYTAMGCGQRMAYSNDRGRTWTKYAGNPVIEQVGDMRDPNIIWHEPTGKWSMNIYVNQGSNQAWFYESDDLKTWTKTGELEDFYECTNLFQLPLDGNENDKHWVIFGADGLYLTGDFDGDVFSSSQNKYNLDWGAQYYAAQTFSDVPDGRRILVTWMRGANFKDLNMPFNQSMGFPVELKLKTFPEGPRVVKTPVSEIELLHSTAHSWTDETLSPGSNLLDGVETDLAHIVGLFEIDAGTEFGFRIKGNNTVSYNVQNQRVRVVGNDLDNREVDLAKPADDLVKIEVLVDRGTLEAFVNDGHRSFTHWFRADPGESGLEVFSEGGNTRLVSLDVYELNSGWDHGHIPVSVESKPDVNKLSPLEITGEWISVLLKDTYELKIIDINGRVQFQKTAVGKNRYTPSHLSKGVYIVHLNTREAHYSKKLVNW